MCDAQGCCVPMRVAQGIEFEVVVQLARDVFTNDLWGRYRVPQVGHPVQGLHDTQRRLCRGDHVGCRFAEVFVFFTHTLGTLQLVVNVNPFRMIGYRRSKTPPTCCWTDFVKNTSMVRCMGGEFKVFRGTCW